MKLTDFSHVYFLGIGGIGMSALARYFSRHNIKITGYDRDQTRLTEKLEAEGMTVHYSTDERFIPDDIELLVYTPAIQESNAIFTLLKSRDIPVMKRSEALQWAVADKFVIAVAGTHGKTTTSAFLAHILHVSGLDVSAFVGGIMTNYGTNFLYGDGPWVVVEADEFDRSFLRLKPDMAVIQAMDPDHLDIYGGNDQLLESFLAFMRNIKAGGSLWLSERAMATEMNLDWKQELIDRDIAIGSFGWSNESHTMGLDLIEEAAMKTKFRMRIGEKEVAIVSHMPGKHNVMNAAGAAAIAYTLGTSLEDIAMAIGKFRGIERRFELVYSDKAHVLIDDYAHHPVEIEAAIDAVRSQFPGWNLTVVFQPHLFSRTRDFMSAFAESLDAADEVYLLPIYPAREKPITGITSRGILELMTIKNKRGPLRRSG